MLDRHVESDQLEMIKAFGLGMIAFSPLAQGLLTNRYLHGIPAQSRVNKEGAFLHAESITDEWLGKAHKLESIAKERGQSLAQMSLSWLLRKEYVTSVIAGVSSVAQLDDNLAAINAPDFTPDQLADIDIILGLN